MAVAVSAGGAAMLVNLSSYTEPRMIGAIGLVLVLAGVVGIAVYQLARRYIGAAYELSLLSSFGTVAALAYFGVEAAGAILWVFLGLLVVAWVISALTQFL